MKTDSRINAEGSAAGSADSEKTMLREVFPAKFISRLEGGLRCRGLLKSSRSDMPLITVVTVTYNADKHLAQTIESVINQTYGNIEYIIIDGGSSDGSLEIIKAYEEYIDYWLSEPDKGIYDAINKGISLARGDYIGILQADDWYALDIVNNIVVKAQEHVQTELKVIYANYTIVNETYATYRQFESTLAYWLGMTISHQSMFVSANVYSKLGLYNTSYRLAADYDYFLKMITAGITFFGINHYGVFFRLGGRSSLANSTSIVESRAINRKYLGMFSKKHLQFLLRTYKYKLLSYPELLIAKIIGEDRVLTIRKRIKKLRNY